MITLNDLKPGNRVLIEAVIVAVPTYGVEVRIAGKENITLVSIGAINSVEKSTP